MIGPVLDTNSHLPLEQQQALYEVLRLCCVCFHFLVYYGFSGCKDTHYFLNVKVFPLKQTKKRPSSPISMPPKVAERRRTSPLKGQGDSAGVKSARTGTPAPLTPKMRLPRCDSPTAPPRLKDATSRNRRSLTYGSSPTGSYPVGTAGLDPLTLPPSILPQ